MQKRKKNGNNYRLPVHVLPEKYKIVVKPDIDAGTFEGEEVILLQINKADNQIVLHSRELEIVTAEYEKSGKQVFAAKVKYLKAKEQAVLTFPKILPKGKASLRIAFRGVLNNQMRGYYKSSYTHKEEKKHLATTQFEATDARMAFPCFDEPNKKAVFELTMVVPEHHEAVSNTLPVSVRQANGYKTIKFAPTPKMSTYLLAFVSGELEFLETKTKHGVQVRVYTTPGKKEQGRFALNVAKKSLEFFEKYFRVPYPLKTLDLVAVPDFASLAMENWGVVTFRESGLLIEENVSSLNRKQLVAMVIAHELAHQWFGNLVTMDWWTHLWLNEGFASYIEFVAVDALFPKWEMWTQFLSIDLVRGRDKDALKSTHPIEVDVHDPNEIDEVFDDISYRKGSSIIRMLVSYLGHETFRKGLLLYFDKHKYANATTEDLWTSLEMASKKPVRKIMSQWTRQEGFPLIRLEKRDEAYFLKQERFFANPKHMGTSKQIWPVPISYSSGSKVKKLLLDELDMRLPEVNSTIEKLNIGETAFVVSDYSAEKWGELAGKVRAGKLSAQDRWGVANNIWSLARAGQMKTSTALELSMSFRRETDISVWREIFSGLGQVKSIFASEGKLAKNYENYVQLLLEPTKKRLGYELKKEDTHNDSLLRPLCFGLLGVNGDIQAQEKALQLLTKAVSGTAVPVYIRTAVYDIVASLGDRPEHTYFKTRFETEQSNEERERLISALCSFSQTSLIQATLKFSLSESVRDQDAWMFCRNILKQPKPQTVLWRFVKENWAKYQQKYGHGGRGMNMVIASLYRVSDPGLLLDMTRFFKQHQSLGQSRTIEQVLENIDINCQWLKRDVKDVEAFFERFS